MDPTVQFIVDKLAAHTAISLRVAVPDWLKADLHKVGIKAEPEIHGYWRFSKA
jgi:hypothetical protein